MRLLAGVAGRAAGGAAVLVGDESLSSRPMDRVAVPLRAMGATVEGRGERCLPPLVVEGGPLIGIEWAPPVASAQVKSAVLLAGLSAEGETVVREAVATRAHTEELLAEAGADITVEAGGAGRVVRLRPSVLRPLASTSPETPPRRPSGWWPPAWSRAAEVTVAHVYVGAGATGFVGVLRRMGARHRGGGRARGDGRPRDRGAGPLHGTVVEAAEIPSLDEVPVLAVAAAAAEGTTVFADVGELRVKERDRLAGRWPSWSGPSGAGPRSDGDDLVVEGVGRAGGLRRRPHRQPAATTAWPWPPRWPPWPPGRPQERLGVRRRWPPATPVPRRPAGAWPGLGQRWRGSCAIDGPAGLGQVDGVAGRWPSALGLDRLDTGAMYRAVAWAACDRRRRPRRRRGGRRLARRWPIEVGERVAVDGTDVTERHPHARGQPGGLGGGGQPGGAPAAGRPPAALGGRATAAAWSRAGTSARVVLPRRRPQGLPDGLARRAGPAPRHDEAPPRGWPGGTGWTRPGPRRRSSRPTTPGCSTHRPGRGGCGGGGAVMAVNPEAADPAPAVPAPRRRARWTSPRGGGPGRHRPRPRRPGGGLPGPAPVGVWLRCRRRSGCSGWPLPSSTCCCGCLPAPGDRASAPAAPGRSSWPRSTGRSPTSGSWPSSPTASSTSWPRTSCGKPPVWAGSCSTSGPSRSTGSRPTARPCAGPRRSCARGRCWSCSPRGPARRARASTALQEGAAFLAAADRGAARAGRHRQLRPGHAQGAPLPQAPEDPGGGGRAHRRPRAQRGRAGCPAAGFTPPPPSSGSGSSTSTTRPGAEGGAGPASQRRRSRRQVRRMTVA